MMPMSVNTGFGRETAAVTRPKNHWSKGDGATADLSVDQHCLLNLDLKNPHWVCCNMLFDVISDVDSVLIGKAFEKLFERHDALRARFVFENGKWSQYLEHRIDRMPVETIRIPAGVEADANYYAELTKSVCSDIDVSRSPLVRCLLIDSGAENKHQLLLVIHHLLFDGVSAAVLVDEFVQLYENLHQGCNKELPAPAVAFSEWTAKLTEYVNEVLIQEELEYWRNLSWHRFKTIPVDYPENISKNTLATHEKSSIRLTEAETDKLFMSLSSAQSVSILDILISAVFEVITEWMNTSYCAMLVHDSGRNAVPRSMIEAPSRTVGWLSFQRFVHLYRANKGIKSIGLLQDSVRQIKAIPNSGMGFKMLKHCAHDPAVKREMDGFPEPALWLNYVGPVTGALENSLLQLSPMMETVSRLWMHPDNVQKWLLSFVVAIEGGELVVSLDRSRLLYKNSTATWINSEVVRRLRAMLDESPVWRDVDPAGCNKP
jgi:microcystin synthetase protein McyA